MKKQDDLYVLEIEERIKRIKGHLKGITKARFLKSALYQSAVIRELEVIGEAARMVSLETQKLFPSIPWRQIIATRNRLIHEYFDVDHELMWEVARFELPKLEGAIPRLLEATTSKTHPWRHCPKGFYYVRSHHRRVKKSRTNPSGSTEVASHCRRNPSGKDQLYPDEILSMTEQFVGRPELGKIGKLSVPKTANHFDAEILFWTRYWNDVFALTIHLNRTSSKLCWGANLHSIQRLKQSGSGKETLPGGCFRFRIRREKFWQMRMGRSKITT